MVRIVSLLPTDNFRLSIVFANGEKRCFDLSPYLEKGIFSELKNPNYFKLVKNEGYFISWPNEQDLSSDTLYAGSAKESD